MSKVAIFGATSAIAQATARLWAAEGHSLFLAARSAEHLEAVKNDLLARGAQEIQYRAIDLNDTAEHQQLVEQSVAALNGIDIALLAYGLLGDQKQAQSNFNSAAEILETNLSSLKA